jgi:nitrite reductase/ring-hydroxylating ferredoxin subunit
MKSIQVLILIFLSVLSACKKDSVTDDPIPEVPVNLTIYLSLPQYSALNSIGNNVIVQGGYKGIIIYRRSLDEFVSFDLACPYDPRENGAILTIESGGVTLTDAHCGSKFNLFDGSVLNGPASRPMKAYNTEYNSAQQVIYIYN